MTGKCVAWAMGAIEYEWPDTINYFSNCVGIRAEYGRHDFFIYRIDDTPGCQNASVVCSKFKDIEPAERLSIKRIAYAWFVLFKFVGRDDYFSRFKYLSGKKEYCPSLVLYGH